MQRVVVEGALNKLMTKDIDEMVVEKGQTGMAGMMLPQGFGAKVLKAPLAPGVGSNPLLVKGLVRVAVVVVWVTDIVEK